MRQGQLIGDRYRLDDRVDSGGMGAVWRATDTTIDRVVAVKILHRELATDARFRRRFESEARALGALRHPGAVALYDYGETTTEDGTLAYLVMEYVPARSLQSLLAERGRLPAAEVLPVLAEVAEILHAAHTAGVIHRDIKPSNILIEHETGAVKLVDFGIARAHGESGLTSTGTIVGTLSYVSPEQLRGEPLTGASDIYSLGVVAYEALTGDRPFTGETPAAIISGHLHRTPPPLPDDLPAAVGDAVNQALHKDPQHRYPTARDLAAALRGLGTGLPPAPRGYAPGKAKGRASTGDTDTIAFTTGLRRWIPTGLAALLVLVAILVVVVPWHDDDPGAMAGDSTNSDEPTDDEEDETSASPSHKNVPSGPKSKTGESTSQSSSPTADSGKKTVCADTPDSSSRFHDAGRGCFHADGHYFEVFDDGPDGYRMVVAWRSLDTGRRDTCETTGPAGTSVECVEPLKSGERISFQLQVRNKDDTLWSSENTPATS